MDVIIQQGTKLEMRNSTFGFKWIFIQTPTGSLWYHTH